MEKITGMWKLVQLQGLNEEIGVWENYIHHLIGKACAGEELMEILVRRPGTSRIDPVDGNPDELLVYDVIFNSSIGKPMQRRGRFRRE